MEIHPACALWPRPSDDEVTALVESIRTEGLHNPIWLYEGAILDGKTRFEACGVAGVEPRFETYTGDNPVKFTIAQNKLRRHQEPGVLALTVAKLCKLPHGGNRSKTLAKVLPTMADFASVAGISESTLSAAKTVLEFGEPNIIEMVRLGDVGAQNASAFVKRTSKEEQSKAKPHEVKNFRNQPGYASTMKTLAEKRKPQPMLTIPLRDVIDKFRPLIKRVKEQSKRHAATVSFVELSVIAHELGQLADAWTENGTENGTHSAPVPLNRVHKGG
jgi:hypothetical protein